MVVLGLSLENFIQPDFGNTTIEVLRGSVEVAIPSTNLNVSLYPGENVTVSSKYDFTLVLDCTVPKKSPKELFLLKWKILCCLMNEIYLPVGTVVKGIAICTGPVTSDTVLFAAATFLRRLDA